MISAEFTINGNTNPAVHTVVYGSTVNLELLSYIGATSIVWEIVSCSEPNEAIPEITRSGTPPGRTASFVMPADSSDGLGRSFLIKCTVSSELLDEDGAKQVSVKYGVVGAVNTRSLLPIAAGEENYRHGTHGYGPEINIALNNSGGGGGGGGSGDVVGPVSSVNNNIVLFNGTTGKSIKDSGTSLTGLIHANGSVAFTADQPMGTHKITGLASGTVSTDAVNKGQLDAATSALTSVATDRLIGRDTAGTGAAEQLTVSGGIEFTGAGGIQRSAVSGDITIAAGSNTSAITSNVIVDADINSAANISWSKLATSIGNLGFTNLKTLSYNGEIDNGNSGTADTITWTAGDLQKSTLTGNCTYTFVAPSGVTIIQLRIIQDGTGGRTVTWPAAVLGSPPQPNPVAGSITFYSFFFDGTNYYSANSALTISSLPNISTDRILGRDTVGTGAPEELTVSGGLEFTGTTGIQRSAVSGDITIPAGSNTSAITAGVIVDTDVNAAAAIAHSKLATIATDSLLGRDTAGTGALETIGLNATLSMTGSNQLQRAALTGDVTAAAGSNVTAIAAGVIVDADINNAAGITITKLGNVTTDKILGRDTAGTGAVEEIAVSGGLEFTGSAGIRRSAITGDVTIAAGATTSIVTDLTIASEVQGSVIFFNGTNWVQLSPGTDGYALTTHGAGANPTWTNISAVGGPPSGAAGGDLAGTYPNPTIATAAVTFAKMQSIATDRLIGRDTAATGAPEEISLNSTLEFTGASSIQRAALTGDVTALAGSNVTAIAAGAVVNADVNAAAAIDHTKLATIATDRLLGRDTAGTGTLEPITVSGGIEFTGTAGIQRSAISGDITIAAGSNTSAITAGVIVDADINASAAIAISKLANIAGSSILGKSTSGTGAISAITATTTGHCLRLGIGGLVFGALDLSSINSTTGLLAVDRLQASAVDGRVLITSATSVNPVWDYVIGNNTDPFSYNGASHDFYVGGNRKILLTSTSLTLYQAPLQWDAAVVDPQVGINSTAAASATGTSLSIYGQRVTGTGSTVGGPVYIQAGLSTNGTGGAMDIRSGTGLTSILAGNLSLGVGNSTVFSYPGNAIPATTGILRGYHGVPSVTGRNKTNTTNSYVVSWGVTADNTATFGDTGFASEILGTSVKIGDSSVYIETASLSGREVLSLMKGTAVTTTQMPANTGDGVIYIANATTVPTTGAPTGGGILWSDFDYGLAWKGIGGAETTLGQSAPGSSGKRRIVDWKSTLDTTTSSGTGAMNVSAFNITNFNGHGLSNGTIAVRGRVIAFGGSSYSSYVDVVSLFRVNSGTLVNIGSRCFFDDPTVTGTIGNGIISASITTLGSVISLTVTPFATGTQFMSYLEVMGAQD